MISKEDVLYIQKKWADAVVLLGKLKDNRAACNKAAHEFIPQLYAVKEKKILFKPTLASQFQFRHTEDEIISYFIGNNPKIKEDKGFAMRPWTEVRFENAGMITESERAIVMGNYFFKSPDGQTTKVEFTFGYIRLEDGTVKIDLHHSSLPYQP